MEQLKERIEKQYTEYIEFEKLVQEKNTEFLKKKEEVPDLMKEGLSETLEKTLVHVYSDMILYNQDLQFLFMSLITNIITYLELSKDPLREDIKSFYEQYRTWYPKRIFAIEKGEIVESEKGIIESKRKEFLESDYYKSILKQGNLISDNQQ